MLQDCHLFSLSTAFGAILVRGIAAESLPEDVVPVLIHFCPGHVVGCYDDVLVALALSAAEQLLKETCPRLFSPTTFELVVTHATFSTPYVYTL